MRDTEEQAVDPTAAGAAAAPATDAAAAPATDADDASAEASTDAHTALAEATDADPRTKGELLGELLTAEAKRDEYLDDLRRSHADFENFRKRTMREAANQRDNARAELVTGLLDVLDDLDRTVDAAAASPDEVLAKGVDLVASKLVEVLRGAGLERIDAADVPFDPMLHDAVAQQAASEPRDEPVVAAVLRPGYRMGERVLRPAMVSVEQ